MRVSNARFTMPATAALVAVTVLALATAYAFPNADPSVVRGMRTGTFSSLTFVPANSQGPGSPWMYTGLEIRIVGHSGGYQATLQRTQVEPIPVAIADAQIDDATGRIVVHWPRHSIVPPCTLEGTVDRTGLVGEITYPGGGAPKEQIKLPRRKSFWD